MITWVLIIIIVSSNGNSTSTAVFHSPQSCQAAAEEIVMQKSAFNKVIAYCTQDININ